MTTTGNQKPQNRTAAEGREMARRNAARLAAIYTPAEQTAEQVAEKTTTEDYWRNFYAAK
jgi:hypothetical protein